MDVIPGLLNNLIEAVLLLTEMSIILSLPYVMYVIMICRFNLLVAGAAYMSKQEAVRAKHVSWLFL